MKRLIIIAFLSLTLLGFCETLPVQPQNQSGFDINSMSVYYKGIKYRMKALLDGEFTIELDCRTDTGAVDIVFVIDNTGSMSGTISGVRSNISGLISELDSRGYDYRLGGVCYGDAVGPDLDGSAYRELYDSTTTATDGWDMTSDFWGSFQPWINGISVWGGADAPENAICAIEAAMNNYDWRPEALHILVFFTDACYYECGDICDGTCAYCDEDVYNDIISGGFVLFSSTRSSPSCSGCSSVGSTGSYNWYHNTSIASGGNWYSLGTSWSTIFSDLVSLIDTFEIINYCVTNSSGSTINPGTAGIIPGSCITILGANPQSYGPWVNGEEHCFNFRMNTIAGCTGIDGCFSAMISGGGYSDTVTGCVFLEDCACPGPEATPICPPCSYPYTACPYQEITISLADSDSYVNTSTITLNVAGVNYHFPDHLSYAGDVLTFTPTTAWTNGQTVHYTLENVEDGMGCPMMSTIDCGFVVDLEPPDITSWLPVCGTEIDDPLNVTLSVSDNLSGMNLVALYFTVAGTPYYGSSPHVNYTGDYYSGTVTLSGSFDDFGIADAGSVQVCFFIEDRVPASEDGCNLCGPNDTMFCCTYYMNNPPTAEFIIPDSASWVACDPAEIFIHFHDPDGDAIDSMSLSLQIWSSTYPAPTTYDITNSWFNMFDETTAVFTPDPAYFPSGDTIYAQLTSGTDMRGASIENLPIYWMFMLDYDPPVYFDHFPPNYSVVYEFPGSAYVDIIDSLSGLDLSSILVTVDGMGSVFSWVYNPDSSYGITIPLPMDLCSLAVDTCTVQICVYSADMPDTCGPNDTTDCWTFYWVFGAPWAEIHFPDPLSIVACEDSTVEIIIHGGVGPIDSNSIILVIDNGDGTPDTFTIDSDWLYVDEGSTDTLLIFSPPMGYWEDADTYLVNLISLADIYGFPASGLPLWWYFYTDFSPPVTYNHYPLDSSVVAALSTPISFDIDDSVAGLNPDSFFVIVTDTVGSLITVDTFYIGDTGVSWDGVHFEIAGLTFDDGDTVWVCVESMQDTPTYCGPNDTSNCWWFTVSVSIPWAQYIQYLPNSYVACIPETIIATIDDPDGINISTLEFWVIQDSSDTSVYHWSDGYFGFYGGDTLIFGSPVTWDDGSVVDVCIAYVEDSLGNPLPEPYCWNFVMDESPPSMVFNFPADGSIFPMQWTGVFEGHFVDTLSGIDTSSYYVVLCGDTFYYPRSGIIVSPGDSSGSIRFTIDPNLLLTDGSWRACSLVCMGIGDMPDYCGPNDTVYCWHYSLTEGPNAEIITPLDGEITACADQCVLIHLWDDDLPVDTFSIIIVINGDTIRWGDGLLSYSAETLIYCPPESLYWVNNEVVNFELISADDSVGAYLQDTLDWSFSVDLESPIPSSFSPNDGDTVGFGTPPICLDLTDNLSGINWDSVSISIDGSVFVFVDTPAVDIVGSSLCFYPDSLGLRWIGGDSAVICIHAIDSPDLCAPNVLDTCWVFYIEPGGPYGTIDHPFSEAWVSCVDTGIVMHINDDDGVIDTSIVISIHESSTGVTDTVSYPDSRLSWDSSTGKLLYHPSISFESSETVDVCILYAEDPIGNPLSPRPVCSSFYIDRYSPVLFDAIPLSGDIVYTRHPFISFDLIDSLSGLDTSSVEIYLNDVHFGGSCVDIEYLGSGVYEFTLDSSCYEYHGCDTVVVHIVSTDSTDYCADNELDTSWIFSVDCEGPHASEIYVPRDLVSSCDSDSIVIWLWDSLPGVNSSTIQISITGYGTISWGDPNLTYSEDTLVYYPTPPLPDEGAISVTLISADDLLGNELEDIVDWVFYVDRISPMALNWSPACGETIANTHPDISIMAYDSGCGVVAESTVVTIDGTSYSYIDGWISDFGDEFVFDPDADSLHFSGGSSVEVCWHLVDCADDICPPNAVDTCCIFYVESGGPWSDISGPCESDWVGCDAETVHISFEDEDGILSSTIQFEVCFGISCDSCDTLDVSSSDIINYGEYADSISFDYIINLPSLPSSDGWQFCVHTLYAEDSLGNTIFDHGHIDSFYVNIDNSPPSIISYFPNEGDTMNIGSPTICVQLSDLYSGIDDDSVSLSIAGIDYSAGDLGFSWDGASACFDAEIAEITWTGGTVVDVCIDAYDNNCACPNELDSCWSFIIAPGGPVATIEHPSPSIVSACENESIFVTLIDPQGDNIIDNSIEIMIWRSTTDDSVTLIYGIDPQLVWDEPSSRLVLFPSPQFADNETIIFCVTSALDTLGNSLEEPVCVQFSMDISPFVTLGFAPADNETVATRTPSISVAFIDSITGIADSSVIMTIDGDEYTLESPALQWLDDTTIIFYPESADVDWLGGNCFDLSLYAYDQTTPGYCQPNDSTVFWTICITPGGPVGSVVRPFNGAYSSCIDEHIVMTIIDPDGVDSSTIRLVVEGDTFSLEDDELTYEDDTLIYTPNPLFVNGQIVNVCLVAADDMLGNHLADTVCWYFTMDFTPPWSQLDAPIAEMVRDRQQDIVITVGDSLSGVDPLSIVIAVDNIPYQFGDFLWTQQDSIQGGVIRFMPEMFDIIFPPGESVCVDIRLTDTTDYCNDNILDSTFCFLIEPEIACLVHPNPFTPNSDNVNDFAIFNYPFMFSQNAEIQIYNLRNVLVFHRNIENISDISDFLARSWNGKDDSANPLPEGLYIWIIISNNEVVCNGTVVLAK
ncbi:gliding motility-associated C-terminal domain-containing protein [bacterium]|nr:gliding motility-associated C-terminal domain-containing protein [bacterium]